MSRCRTLSIWDGNSQRFCADNVRPNFLHSYSAERQAIAKELIDYDREWAKMISAPLKSADDPDGEGVDPAEVQSYFVKHGRYTAGTATRYTQSKLTAALDPSGSRQRTADRYALSFRARRPVGRRQSNLPLPCGKGRRTLATFRFLRSGRSELTVILHP